MRALLLLLLLSTCLKAEPLKLTVEAEKAILMNAKTGKVLFAKEADKQAFPASTTKIATALVALHKGRGQLGALFTADRESLASITPHAKKQSNYRSPPHWLETDSSHMGIKKGEELSLRHLLEAMMIVSANDAANVIAQGLGGTIPQFMEETNAFLKKVGCKNTHYNNPSGLHHPDHVTTAYDLALMAKEGLKDPLFREIVSTARGLCPQTNLELERILIQTNQLLKKGPYYYPQAIGVKTGSTSAAGKNLVAAAQEGDRLLIAVALGYKGVSARANLYRDVIKMFEAAFNETKMRKTLLVKGEQKLTLPLKGGRKPLKTYLKEDLAYEFYPSEEVPVKVKVKWEVPPLPIAPGTYVGVLSVVDGQESLIHQQPLYALNAIKTTLWYKITHLFVQKRGRQIAFGCGVAFLFFFLWKLRRRAIRRSP